MPANLAAAEMTNAPCTDLETVCQEICALTRFANRQRRYAVSLLAQGSTAQPLREFVEPRRETRRPVNDHVGQLGEGILLG